jgi:holo-[acyl-carrier protein] synthase
VTIAPDFIGIGIDIEEIARFKGLGQKDVFIRSIFTTKEIAYCFMHSKPEIHLAGIFSAKEAVKKAIGGRLSFSDVEVTHDSEGKPSIIFLNKKKCTPALKVSISHAASMAVAVVVALGK